MSEYLYLGYMRRFLAFILIFLTIGSQASLALNVHYCGGRSVKTSMSLGTESLSCGMPEEGDQRKTPQEHDRSINTPPCCDDLSIVMETEAFAPSDLSHASVWNDLIINTTLKHVDQILNPVLRLITSPSHAPPPLKTNFQIVFQVFRI